MTPVHKPRRRDGYTSELTELVRSACLSVAVTLAAFEDDLCVVGGLVPTLLIDVPRTQDATTTHPGTLDLDVGLAIALLDDERYVELSQRLRQEAFEPDENEQGNATLQRWRHAERAVTIDFLIAPIDETAVGGRVHPLDPELGAVVTPGLELAFDERLAVRLRGRTLRGERASRTVPVCGPGAFVILKALAFADRAEPKDAFDLAYTIGQWPEGAAGIAERIARHSGRHAAIVQQALKALVRDFETVDTIGPIRVVEFQRATGDGRDEIAVDAHGHVDDLLRACLRRGLAVA